MRLVHNKIQCLPYCNDDRVRYAPRQPSCAQHHLPKLLTTSQAVDDEDEEDDVSDDERARTSQAPSIFSPLHSHITIGMIAAMESQIESMKNNLESIKKSKQPKKEKEKKKEEEGRTSRRPSGADEAGLVKGVARASGAQPYALRARQSRCAHRHHLLCRHVGSCASRGRSDATPYQRMWEPMGDNVE